MTRSPEAQALPQILGALPPFPAVARKLMSLLGRPDIGFQQVTELIRSDAALAAQVLRLANSALFGRREEISSILRALVIIGAERVKALAATAAMRTYLGPLLDGESRSSVMLRRCWRENLVCALIAEDLAKSCWLDPDIAYTAGLLHDLGRLALLKSFASRYCDLLDSSAEDDADLLVQERAAFGVDHCTAGAWMAQTWGFPQELAETIRTHHDPIASHLLGLPQLICAARVVAAMLDFQAVGPSRPWNLLVIQALLDTGNGRPFRTEREEFERRIVTDVNAIECSLI